MTSSGASDRTPPPLAPSRPIAGAAPNLLKRFLVRSSGVTPELLYAPSYLTELNKYALLGALLCFTAGFAALSGGYAAYTAFRDTAVATALGVLWGLFIFTLDRLIVSGIRKQQHEPNDTWAVWLGKSLREILQAFPRLVLAVFLALVIATPLELKLFEREIQWYIAHETQMRAIEAEQLAQEEFSDIKNLRTRNQELFQLLRAKEKRRDPLRDQAVAELATNTATRTRLEAQKQQRLAVVKTVAENANGLLARLNALHQLARDRDNLALGWAILVIFFVFLAVETAPVLTKVMFRYGPYDMLLERIETEVVLLESQRLRSAQERITAAAQYRSNTDLQAEPGKFKA